MKKGKTNKEINDIKNKVSWYHLGIDDDVDTAALRYFVENKKESKGSLVNAALKHFLSSKGFYGKKLSSPRRKATK